MCRPLEQFDHLRSGAQLREATSGSDPCSPGGRNPHGYYVLGTEIASGSDGDVFSAVRVFAQGSGLEPQPVALKRIKLLGPKPRKHAHTELRVAATATGAGGHEHLVRLLDFFGGSDGLDNVVFLVMQMCAFGLDDLIAAVQEAGEVAPTSAGGTALGMRARFAEFELRRLLQQMVEALSFLNHLRIIHRDVKPENILWAQQQQQQQRLQPVELGGGIYKLCDFGVCVFADTLSSPKGRAAGRVLSRSPSSSGAGGSSRRGRSAAKTRGHSSTAMSIQELSPEYPSSSPQSESTISSKNATSRRRAVRATSSDRIPRRDEGQNARLWVPCQGRGGTLWTMCPEVLRGEAHDASCDIWSLACVLFEMAFLEKPFTSLEMLAYQNDPSNKLPRLRLLQQQPQPLAASTTPTRATGRKQTSRLASMVQESPLKTPALKWIYSKDLKNVIQVMLTHAREERPTAQELQADSDMKQLLLAVSHMSSKHAEGGTDKVKLCPSGVTAEDYFRVVQESETNNRATTCPPACLGDARQALQTRLVPMQDEAGVATPGVETAPSVELGRRPSQTQLTPFPHAGGTAASGVERASAVGSGRCSQTQLIQFPDDGGRLPALPSASRPRNGTGGVAR